MTGNKGVTGWQARLKLVLFAGLALAILSGAGCTAVPGFDDRLHSIVEPYEFSIAQWELDTIPREVQEWACYEPEAVDDEVAAVQQYFLMAQTIKTAEYQLEAAGGGQGDTASLEAEMATLRERKSALVPAVERILARQVREALVQQGIHNPLLNIKVGFPPLNYTLATPPHLVVVSPRDRIESMREITLEPVLGLEDIQNIEDKIDALGVSSLVVELGGFGGTYPTFVSDSGGLRYTIDTVVEEWLHQYLAFTPLGFSYLLDTTGVLRNYEIATMNETLAGMVSGEIGGLVYREYYSSGDEESQRQDTGFDFNLEMRQIRIAVDAYLAQGEIDKAEALMAERRQYLMSNGYYIRKLNQAYFAFHGAYADEPTSISPIGVDMRKLRGQSASLKDFLDKASLMTNRADLQQSLK
ncbi:hypothetical protein ACFLYF_06105 [Chloroflexota bacterium]